MFLPKSTKTFAALTALFAASCGYWQGNSNITPAPAAPFVAEELKSGIPFASKEPGVYQAEIVLTTYAGGEKSERKIFTARSGAKLRSDYENNVSFLQSDGNIKYLINNGRKVYAESQITSGAAGDSGNTIKDFLTAEWLNEKRGAKFENLGAENGLTKYRVSLTDAPNKDSETLIFVDENLKIPVRQEFYATNDGQKVLVFSMEMRNIKLEADDKLFELPKDYRKISPNEFQKMTRQNKLKIE